MTLWKKGGILARRHSLLAHAPSPPHRHTHLLLSPPPLSSVTQRPLRYHPSPLSSFFLLRHKRMSEESSSSSDESSSSSRPTAADFICAGRDIQNRSARRVSSDATEARLFREHFGSSPAVVSILWHRLDEHALLPPRCQIWHLLWALYFFKVYPKQGTACCVAGGPTGAVDPKTFRKWVWAFIECISSLEAEVVSKIIIFV